MLLKRALVAASVTVAAFLLIPGSPAQAKACGLGIECRWAYYSDAARTNLVGTMLTTCDGVTVIHGEETGYYTYNQYPC